MHKYYKKLSSSAVSLLDPQFIGQKKELILNELGATLCKINRKCGDICLFENPSLLGARRIKIKRKHRHQKHSRPAEFKEAPIRFVKSIEQSSKREKRHPEKTIMFESQRIKDNKEPKVNKHLIKHESDDLSKAKYSRDHPRKDENENTGGVRRHRTRGSSKVTKEQLQRELENLDGKVRHLYEDSKTEIYFVNEQKSRKRKLKAATYDDSHDAQKDETICKNFPHKHHSRYGRNQGESRGKNTESSSIMDHPITVATLAQLQHLFFRTKTDDLKAKEHKKHSESHTKRIHRRKHSEVYNIPGAHHHHLTHKNLVPGLRDPSIVKDEIVNTKHPEELSCRYPNLSRDRSSNYSSCERRKHAKRKHKKEDKISLRLVEKSKKHRKKKDIADTLETDSNLPTKSLFQNLHVNFGKCILMEDSKLKNKLVNPNESVFNSDAMTQNSRIKKWIRTQLTSNFSKETMKKNESSTKRRKSETSIPCTSCHQISPMPSKLYRKRSHISGKTEHESFKKTVDDLFAFEKEIDNKLSKISTRDNIAGHPVKDKEGKHYALSRSKSLIPFVTESKVEELTTSPEATEVIKSADSTYRKLSNIDYGYYAEKLKKVLGDGSLKDVEHELNLFQKTSQRSLSTKQKLKKLVRTSYSCIFEYPPTCYIPRTSSKSRSRSHRKNEPEIILCDNTVSIEDKWISEKKKPRIHLQNVSMISLQDEDSKKEGTDIEISSVKDDSMEITTVRKQLLVCKEGESSPKVVVTETKPQLHDSDNSNAEIAKDKSSNETVVPLQEDSPNFTTGENIYSIKPETLTTMVFHIVDIRPMNATGENDDTCKLKPSIKKVTFPDDFEEMVERRKRTSSPFRRYYRYANDGVDVTDIGSQTLDAVFSSDYHVADCVSDSYEDDECVDQQSLLKPTKSTTSLMTRKIPVRIMSRIPVKIITEKSRLTKQDTMRRRDIRLLSDSSSRISTSGSSKDFDAKKEIFIPKENAWIQKSMYISRASSPLDVSRNVQQNYGFGDGLGRKTVGMTCGVPAVQNANTSYHVVEPRNRSTPSSIKTDSEAHSARSSRSRSSWNVIKNPVDIPSHSVVENRPVSKSTFRCSENSFPISTAGSLSHQHYKVDDDGKVDGRVLIDELLKRIASIKQDVVSPYEYNYAERIVPPSEVRRVKSRKKEAFDGGFGEKYCISKSLSPPKSRLPVHFWYMPENSRARSFIEEQRYKAKNYRTKNQESKKAKETPKTKKTKRSSSKSAPPTPVGISTDSEVVNVPKEEAKPTDLSVIASKSETNINPPPTPKDKLRSYSRMSSRITVDHFSPPSRLPKPSQKPEENASSKKETVKDNLANPNSSTLFLTKDYKDKAHLNSYQRRKNYDLNIRKHWKTRSESEEKKYMVPPQVFEVRYVTITKDDDKQNAVVITRSTQNTLARSCQVSNYSSSNYENSLSCASKENISPSIKEKSSDRENEKPHILAPRENSEVSRENSLENDGEEPRILPIGEKLEVTFCKTAADSAYKSTNEDRCIEKKLSESTRGSKVSLSIRKKARHRKKKKKKKKLRRNSEVPVQEQRSTVIALHSTELDSNLYEKARRAPTADVTTSVSGNRSISKDNLLDTALRFAANMSFDCRKDLIKNLQREYASNLPFTTLALERNRSISFSDQVLVNKDTKVEDKKVDDGSENRCFKDYICNAFCCCCVRDTDEPPNKKRKYSKSKKQRAKKKTRKAEGSVTQNFRVHLERTLDINYVKSGLDLKLTFGEKSDNQTHPDCNQNECVTDNNVFYPIEWFRNIKNFVYHEQSVDGRLGTLPSKSLDSLDNHFGSEVGSSVDKSCLVNLEQSTDSKFVSQQNSSNNDIPKPALLVKSKSEITLKTMQNVECSSLTSNLQTIISLSTSYSSCLPNSIDESIIEADHNLDEVKMASHSDSNKNSHFVDVSSLKTIHQSSADLDKLKSISLSKFTRGSDNNSCDLLLSSKESGYTSLPSSKTPSPTSFFKRKSIMDLLKFPVERRKSKPMIIDVNNCTDCSLNDETQELFKKDCASVNSCSSSDDFLRVNRFNKMAKDCQMYAHKVRMLSMKKKDGIYEEQDNYREISLDVLLGRNPKCVRDRNNHPFAYKTGSQCLIVLDDSKSVLSLVGSTIEEDLSCVGDKQNLHCLTEESSATSLAISNSCDHFTKSSKSEGMLVFNEEGTRGNVQVTRSENLYERNDVSSDLDLKRLSFENFSNNLSTKMADREFFQKLLMVYEKENEIAERLYHDDEFFKTELEALKEKNNYHSQKKKSRGIFSMFKRKRKEDMSLAGGSICGRTSAIDDASQTNLDQFSSESCKEDWFSAASDKANSSDELEGTSPETFRKLACQVRRHFGPMVEALNATKFANDDFKLNGFLKLLEKIEQGDVSLLQKNDIFNVEERTKEQVRHCFGSLYEALREVVAGKKSKITPTQLDFIKLLSTTYRNYLNTYANTLAVYIGNGTISTEKQLKAAVVFLMRLDGKAVNHRDFEKCIESNE